MFGSTACVAFMPSQEYYHEMIVKLQTRPSQQIRGRTKETTGHSFLNSWSPDVRSEDEKLRGLGWPGPALWQCATKTIN